MATSFSGGGRRNTRREPLTLGKQLVNFITCSCKSSAPICNLQSWARTHAVLVIGLKETSFGYNYEHNQYFTCSSSCIYICLHNLYICQIIFPSFTDICVTRIAIVLIKKKKEKRKTKQTYHASLINLGSFNWSTWSKPRKSDRSCICVVR